MTATKYSIRPWRRGIGNEYRIVFDNQGSVVCRDCGAYDGNLIAAVPDIFASIRPSGTCSRNSGGLALPSSGER